MSRDIDDVVVTDGNNYTSYVGGEMGDFAVSAVGNATKYKGETEVFTYTKLYETDVECSTTSTSATSVKVMAVGTKVWTNKKLIYVRVRDKAGKRNGYFYGTDNFLPINNLETTPALSGSTQVYSYNGDKNQRTSGGYGVFLYSVASSGNVTMYARYNSTNSRKIDGTYHIEVYLLEWADNISPFA